MMLENMVVLYIEDDDQSRLVMEFMLTRVMSLPTPYLFSDSRNLMERIEALPAKPDVIFVDIYITPYDGFTILKMLRSHPNYQGIPVVALTASVMSEEVLKIKAVGFSSLISKPVRIDYFQLNLPKILRGESVWIVK